MRKPLPVLFRAQALDDLNSIADFIGKENPSAASRVIQRIQSTIFGTLAYFPHAGRLDKDTGVREFAVPRLPYLIIFAPLPEALDVIAAFHTSRDPSDKPKS